jgi:meso-butanediol dehydrogenase / (S,S)-butanediol dehydrogenase / diacetyl reductase
VEGPVKGQVAIVTGAAQGIGRAIALRLAQDGMDIVIVDLRGEQAENVAAEVRELGVKALPLTLDVTFAEDRQQMIAQTLLTFNRLDVLVNNAAIQRVSLPLDVTEQHWDSVMNVNAKAVYFCCTAALQHMSVQKSGRIVNIASTLGKASSPIYHPVYTISKATTIATTKTLALAHANDSVRINAVCPGVIATPMQNQIDLEQARLSGQTLEQIQAERLSRVPLGRIEQPEEVAAVVSFLVGPDSRFMTGQAINVTGGMAID